MTLLLKLFSVFLLNWVAKFGSPKSVTIDRGAQFESSLFQSTIQFLNCERHHMTAHHPVANGLVERFHRQLKSTPIARNISNDWLELTQQSSQISIYIQQSQPVDLHLDFQVNCYLYRQYPTLLTCAIFSAPARKDERVTSNPNSPPNRLHFKWIQDSRQSLRQSQTVLIDPL